MHDCPCRSGVCVLAARRDLSVQTRRTTRRSARSGRLRAVVSGTSRKHPRPPPTAHALPTPTVRRMSTLSATAKESSAYARPKRSANQVTSSSSLATTALTTSVEHATSLRLLWATRCTSSTNPRKTRLVSLLPFSLPPPLLSLSLSSSSSSSSSLSRSVSLSLSLALDLVSLAWEPVD